MKNYNNELEIILDQKPFSVEVKNILLSMLYRISTSYDDYAKVKVNVEDKKQYIENLLNAIKYCNEITLIEPTKKENNNKDIYDKFKVDKIRNKIETFPNEEVMLSAIDDLNYLNITVSEDYKLIKNSLPELINKGKKINNTEIIRDFDTWTWNTQTDEISSIEANLVYQNLQLLIGYDKLNELFNLKDAKFDIKGLQDELTNLYGEQDTQNFLNLLYKISIILCVNENLEERKRLFEEKKWTEKEYNRLNNKQRLIDDIASSKKVIMNKIKDIDLILNNRDRLVEEYNKRNEGLPEYKKIFSVSHFAEILLKERKSQLESMEEYNKILDPRNYINIKSKFEKDLDLLSNIKLDGTIKTPVIKQMVKIQKVFLDCLSAQIEKAHTKKDILDLIYKLRYYNFLPFTKTECIKDIGEFNSQLIEVQSLLVDKMYEYKLVNKNTEFMIYNIFYTKIVSLENIEYEIKIKDENAILIFYDEKTVAETMEIDIGDIDFKRIKLNKKMKLFI